MYIVPQGILTAQKGTIQRLQQRKGNNFIKQIWAAQLFQMYWQNQTPDTV